MALDEQRKTKKGGEAKSFPRPGYPCPCLVSRGKGQSELERVRAWGQKRSLASVCASMTPEDTGSG